MTAVYLINRLPSPLLSNKCPFELLYHRPPSLDHLKVFGCLCYAIVVHPIHKFASRAKRCIFVGYPTGQKGYKLYDIETKKFLSLEMLNFMKLFSHSLLLSPHLIKLLYYPIFHMTMQIIGLLINHFQ